MASSPLGRVYYTLKFDPDPLNFIPQIRQRRPEKKDSGDGS
jgi:hypothetical protein